MRVTIMADQPLISIHRGEEHKRRWRGNRRHRDKDDNGGKTKNSGYAPMFADNLVNNVANGKLQIKVHYIL